MPIPNEIPVGARIVVRTLEGVDPTDHRMKFRDYVGHVRSWDGQKLEMTRDAAANGSRPEQRGHDSRRRNRDDQAGAGTFHDSATSVVAYLPLPRAKTRAPAIALIFCDCGAFA